MNSGEDGIHFYFQNGTFPEEAIPLMTARQTIIQATSRDRVIFTFSPPLSAMVLVVFRVWRYQK